MDTASKQSQPSSPSPDHIVAKIANGECGTQACLPLSTTEMLVPTGEPGMFRIPGTNILVQVSGFERIVFL